MDNVLAWIKNNKEWLFSGSGLIILGIVFKVPSLIIKRFKKKPKETPTSSASIENASVTQGPQSTSLITNFQNTRQVVISQSSSSLPVIDKPKISKITPDKFIEDIQNTHVDCRQNRANEYVGNYIRWNTYFGSVTSTYDNKAIVCLHAIHSPVEFINFHYFLLYGTVDLAYYTDLKVIQIGTPVIIEGHIHKIEINLQAIELTDLILEY